MTGKTHLALGIACGIVLTVEHSYHAVTTIAVAGLASLLPDIDEEDSKLNHMLFRKIPKRFRPLTLATLGCIGIGAYWLYAVPEWILLLGLFLVVVSFASHRGMTHAPLMLILATGAMSLVWPAQTMAFALGYGSHLIADAVTHQGIPMFWPYEKRYGLRNMGIRIRTGGFVDYMLGGLAVCGAVVVIIYQYLD